MIYSQAPTHNGLVRVSIKKDGDGAMLTFIDTQWSVMLSVPPFKLQSSFTLSLMYAPSLRQTLLLLLFKISHQRFPSDNLSLSPPLDV